MQVHTQSEFDKAVALPHYCHITINGSEEIIVRNYCSKTISAIGNSVVRIYGNSAITAAENSAVLAYDESIVAAVGSSVICAYDECSVYGGACMFDSVVIHVFSKKATLAGRLNTKIIDHLNQSKAQKMPY